MTGAGTVSSRSLTAVDPMLLLTGLLLISPLVRPR
jgi:hypothetical protein